MAQRRILLVAAGEEEVQAYRFIANHLIALGNQCRVVTWLPRLAGAGVESVHTLGSVAPPLDDELSLARSMGFADASMAADYDRDWYFASCASKRQHSTRMIRTAEFIIRTWQPDFLVSSVGGETLRIIFEAVAKRHAVRSLFFNAIPLDGRFVILPSMSAPFVPRMGEYGYMPSGRQIGDNAETLEYKPGPFINNLGESKWDPFARLYQTKIRDRRIYPRNWFERKVVQSAKSVLMSNLPARGSVRHYDEINVLYPMHDERDFQVAVRERHAVPQAHLLKYVASTLPPGYRLWVKPHPHHLAAHHELLMREIRDCPNIGFLTPRMSFEQAISECDVVFTLASTLGFEAIRRSKPVVCYGSPFYSGYGVTSDVGDPRLIAQAITKSVGTIPSDEAVAELVGRMEKFSWPGQFTPLELSADNLVLIVNGVLDVIRSN